MNRASDPDNTELQAGRFATLGTDAVTLRQVSQRILPGGPLVLSNIDLTIHAGELVNLAGPSGSGKSTLLRLLNRLDDPLEGEVAVLGRPLTDWPVRALRRESAFVFQEPVLLSATVRQELRLPFLLRGEANAPDAAVDAARDSGQSDALEAAGLGPEFLDRSCKALSVGQRQRVALARALVTKPKILLLDEPTSGLDEETAFQLLNRLKEINRRYGTTLIVANHRLAEVRHLGGRLVVLMEGRVTADGPVNAVFSHPPSERIGAFLNGNRDAASLPPASSTSAEKGTP